MCRLAHATSGEPYSPPPFDHYQPILDRMPFGALPTNFNSADPAAAKAEAQVKAEQQALAKKVNMSAVNITPDGATAIGFSDLSVNPPVNYYVRVGGAAGGWNVISADYDDEIATIEKEGVTITLKLGQGLIDNPTNPPLASARQPIPTAQAPVPSGSPARFGSRGLPSLHPPSEERHNSISSKPFRGKTVVGEAAAADSTNDESTGLSYAERLRERNTQKTQAQLEAETKLKAQFEKLARETAAREIQRREEEAAMAIQQQSEETQDPQPAQDEQTAPEETPQEQQ